MSAGRKRAFDKELALEIAMKVFWKNGFVGTSISELTGALGINKPSLYAAFGNKEQIFLKALERYGDHYGLFHAIKLVDPEGAPLRDRVRRYLLSIATMLSDPGLPGGCLIAQTTLAAGGNELPEEAVRSIARVNAKTRRNLTEFFVRERDRGNLLPGREPSELATYLMTVFFGMAAMARIGCGIGEFEHCIELAVEVF